MSDDPRAGPHCALRGAVNERTGTDGKPYAIGFEMRLPDRWNGRYFDQVNGGNDGAVVPAYGNLRQNQPDNALARGYAVLSSDSGHDGQANRDAGLVGGNLFGFDEQARLDYGYAANVTLTPLAKTIIERYYGRRPEYSYMVGCSNGGRHALVGATRARARVRRLSRGRARLQPADGLAPARLGHAELRRRGRRHPRRAFSREDMKLVADAVLKQCDALDGAADGIVGASPRARRRSTSKKLQCERERRRRCLERAAVAALTRAFGGAEGQERKRALRVVAVRRGPGRRRLAHAGSSRARSRGSRACR